MSCNYADGLSPYENKGKLGQDEIFDSEETVRDKVAQLAAWISEANHVVVHTGAGISTSAGIPDFRGPKGVWTLEAKGEKPEMNISFNDATPTKTHMALAKLIEVGKIHYIVSQNIDGLHLRSGVPRKNLAELHGNMFVEQCGQCNRQFVRRSATSSVGQKCLLKPCPTSRLNGRPCRGRMHDTILDWEANLPENDLGMADFHSCVADLCICFGTTLQIVPSGNLPLHTKKYNNGRLVICNLQPTKHDRKADLLIHTYIDNIVVQLMEKLALSIPEYSRLNDPTMLRNCGEWTILDSEVQAMRRIYEDVCCKGKRKNSPTKEIKALKKKIKSENGLDIKLEKPVENIKQEVKIIKKEIIESDECNFKESNSINAVDVTG